MEVIREDDLSESGFPGCRFVGGTKFGGKRNLFVRSQFRSEWVKGGPRCVRSRVVMYRIFFRRVKTAHGKMPRTCQNPPIADIGSASPAENGAFLTLESRRRLDRPPHSLDLSSPHRRLQKASRTPTTRSDRACPRPGLSLTCLAVHPLQLGGLPRDYVRLPVD